MGPKEYKRRLEEKRDLQSKIIIKKLFNMDTVMQKKNQSPDTIRFDAKNKESIALRSGLQN